MEGAVKLNEVWTSWFHTVTNSRLGRPTLLFHYKQLILLSNGEIFVGWFAAATKGCTPSTALPLVIAELDSFVKIPDRFWRNDDALA